MPLLDGAKYVGFVRMDGVVITVSPEKSMKVTRPGAVGLGMETAAAYLVGCPAGPTGLMALTTGRY